MATLPPILLLHADGTDNSQVFINSATPEVPLIFTPRGTARISTTDPKWGTGSLIFDSTASILEVTQGATQGIVLDSGDFTIECWVFPLNVSGTQSIVSRWQNQSYSWYAINGRLAFAWAPFSTNVVMMTGNALLTANQWSHVAVTRQGNVWSLWQNGVRVATATNATNATPNPGVPTTIGAYYIGLGSVTGAFRGRIDEVRIIKGEAVYSGTTYEVPTGPFDTEYVPPEVRQIALELVAAKPETETTRALFAVNESVILGQPTRIETARTSLEVVASDAQPLPDRALFSVSESVLLALPIGRVSRVSLEVVAESGIVPPTNQQQVVWFATS